MRSIRSSCAWWARPAHLVEPDADAMVGRATDGRIWQINAYVPVGEAPPKPRRLVINGRALIRD
jgi:hypothetical protein